MTFVWDFEPQQHPFFTFAFNIGAIRISVKNSCKKSFIREHTFIPSTWRHYFYLHSKLHVCSFVLCTNKKYKTMNVPCCNALTATVVISWLHLIHNILPQKCYRKKIKYEIISQHGKAYTHAFQTAKKLRWKSISILVHKARMWLEFQYVIIHVHVGQEVQKYTLGNVCRE
jgi:hypothetical protein